MSEYENEPIPGLPGPLPEGESILWQGSPKWTSLARHLCHVRVIAIYFAVLMLARFAFTAADGRPMVEAVQVNVMLALLCAATIGLLCLFTWLVARSTIYTITTARLAFRFGIALPKIINIPFSRVEGAALREHSDGTGDIPVTLTGDDKIAYVMLWPHARPFYFKKPEPMLRGVTEPAHVAKLLADALAAYTRRLPAPNSEMVSQPNRSAETRAAA